MKQRWVLVFNLLVIYIFMQFIWWAILISKQLSLIYVNEDVFRKKLYMILGEGAVFVSILSVGIYFVRKSIKREMEVNQRQKNFLLAVTHELKTPIAVSKLSLQTIAQRELTVEKRNEIIEKAIKETDRLNSLVENILLSVKLDENQIQLEKKNCFIGEKIKNQVELLHSLLGKNHLLKFEIDYSATALVDERYFLSVISNLYENAIKYTAVGCEIKIIVKQNDNKNLVSVCDNGNGMSAIERERVFDRFYRAGNEETRSAKGTGLGLFIAKQLIEMHGAKISCHEVSPKGTEFRIVI